LDWLSVTPTCPVVDKIVASVRRHGFISKPTRDRHSRISQNDRMMVSEAFSQP
jgi:hypothetical protein